MENGQIQKNREYQRYVINYAGDEAPEIEVIVEGELVRLVDFSIGGVFFLTKKSFTVGEIVSLSIDLENRGKIDLVGKVVRVKPEGETWGVAIDLSHVYKLKTLRKI
jgi:hypothetical protein